MDIFYELLINNCNNMIELTKIIDDKKIQLLLIDFITNYFDIQKYYRKNVIILHKYFEDKIEDNNKNFEYYYDLFFNFDYLDKKYVNILDLIDSVMDNIKMNEKFNEMLILMKNYKIIKKIFIQWKYSIIEISSRTEKFLNTIYYCNLYNKTIFDEYDICDEITFKVNQKVIYITGEYLNGCIIWSEDNYLKIKIPYKYNSYYITHLVNIYKFNKTDNNFLLVHNSLNPQYWNWDENSYIHENNHKYQYYGNIKPDDIKDLLIDEFFKFEIYDYHKSINKPNELEQNCITLVELLGNIKID